jgi:hypothetical protein
VSAGRLEVTIDGAALTAIESALVPLAPTVSAALTVKLAVPDAAGVPVTAPVAAASDSPAGRLPEETDQVSAPVPPVAAMVWLYAMPTVSAGRLAVVIAGAALIAILNARVAVAPTLSATFAVKLAVPDAVGVPVIDPVEALSASPAGSAPAERDHDSAPVPPVAASVWTYATPTVSPGRLAVVIAGAAFVTIESAFVAVALPLSVTFAVKLDVPEAVGVPEITPVEGASVTPAGRLPDWIAHV